MSIDLHTHSTASDGTDAPRALGALASAAGLSVLALTDQVPQMIAHGRGARKFGATVDELREAIYTGVEDEDRTSQLARRV